MALVLAQLVLGQCTQMPRCTTVETTGEWEDQTFIPTASPPCYYGVPTRQEALDLLDGSWLFLIGGSNTWAQYQIFANQLNPYVYNFTASRGSEGPKGFTDMIMERHADGTYTMLYFVWSDDQSDFADLAAQVPTYRRSGLVRVSHYLARLWSDVSAGMTSMQQALNGWADAGQVVHAQAGHWYDTNSYAEKGITRDNHLPDLTAFLEAHQATCTAAGTACFISSTSCIEASANVGQNWRRCNENDRFMEDELVAQVGPGAAYSSAFTFFEVDRFITQNWREFPGHYSPQLGLWTTWVILNALPAATRAFGDASVGCQERVEFEDTCNTYNAFGSQVMPQSEDGSCNTDGCDCPEYRQFVRETGEKWREWKCGLFRPCVYRRTFPLARPPPARTPVEF